MRSLLLSLATYLSLTSSLSAAGFDSLLFRPTPSTSAAIQLWTPEILGQYAMHFSTDFVYQKAPFKLLTSGVASETILDNVLVQYVQGALGVKERWLEIGFDLPIAWIAEYKDPTWAASTSESRTRSGDLRLYLKSEILPRKPNESYSLGLVSSVFVPTGSSEEFLGHDSLAWDFQILGRVFVSDEFSLSTNLGTLFWQKFQFRDFEQTHQILYSLGAHYKVSNEVFLMGEFLGRTKIKAPFNKRTDNPTEASAAVRFEHPSRIWGLDLGANLGIVRGAGVPNYKVFLGFHLTNGIPEL